MLHIVWFQSEKAIYCKIISILEKIKNYGATKSSVLARSWDLGRKIMNRGSTGFLGLKKYCVCNYNDGACHHTFVQSYGMYKHQEWTLRYTADSKWLWCISVSSSVVTNVPLWWEVMRETKHVWDQGNRWEISNFPSILL